MNPDIESEPPRPDVPGVGAGDENPFASTTKLLALDGVLKDRLEVMEMFTEDFNVVGASTAEEALEIIETQDVGVIVTDSSIGGDGEDRLELLMKAKRKNPFLTIVVLSAAADSETIVRLINHVHIYRLAMKPISRDVFRQAVFAAMREHHRMLADPVLAVRHMKIGPDDLGVQFDPDNPEIIERIVKSLSRFTKVW